MGGSRRTPVSLCVCGLVGLSVGEWRENGLRCRNGLAEQAGEEVGSLGRRRKRRENPRHWAGARKTRRDAEAPKQPQQSHRQNLAFPARPQRQGRVGGISKNSSTREQTERGNVGSALDVNVLTPARHR